MFLDPVEDVQAVLAVHHVDGQAPLPEAPRAADAVKVRLVIWIPVFIHREVKVDDNRDLLYVNP